MAKRMQYSVVGLPHYVIWHLYEPSVDDIRHMEVRNVIDEFSMHMMADSFFLNQEMEQERIAREKDEAEKRAKEQKIKDEFGDANAQWEKDRQELGRQQHGQENQQQDQQQKPGGDSSDKQPGAVAKAAGEAAH